MDFNLQFCLMTTCVLVGATVTYFYVPIFTIEGEEGRKTPHQYVRYQFLETGKNLPKKTKTDWIGPEEKENSVPSGTENGRGEISTLKMAEENAVSLLGKIFYRFLPKFYPAKRNQEKEAMEMFTFKLHFNRFQFQIEKAREIRNEIFADLKNETDPKEISKKIEELYKCIKGLEFQEKQLKVIDVYYHQAIPNFEAKFRNLVHAKTILQSSYIRLEKTSENELIFPVSPVKIMTKNFNEIEKLQKQALYLIENDIKNATKFEYERMYQLIRLQSIQNQLHEKQKDLTLEGLEYIQDIFSAETYNSFLEKYKIIHRQQIQLNNYELMAMPDPSLEKGKNFLRYVTDYEKAEKEGNTLEFYKYFCNDYIRSYAEYSNPFHSAPTFGQYSHPTFKFAPTNFGRIFTEFKDEISSAENLQKELVQMVNKGATPDSLAQEYRVLEKAIQMLEDRKNQCQFPSMFPQVPPHIQEEIKNYEIRLINLKKYLNPSYEEKPTIFYSIWEGGIDWDFFFHGMGAFPLFFPLFLILLSLFWKRKSLKRKS